MQVTSGARAGRASTPTDHDPGPRLPDAPSVRAGDPGSGAVRRADPAGTAGPASPLGVNSVSVRLQTATSLSLRQSVVAEAERENQTDRPCCGEFRGAHMHIRGDHAELVVGGRLDVRSAADARTVLHSAVDDGAGDLVLNLTELDSWDATGLGVIMGAHRRAGRAAGGSSCAVCRRRCSACSWRRGCTGSWPSRAGSPRTPCHASEGSAGPRPARAAPERRYTHNPHENVM